ncbi:MAG: DUF1028 domain-containing protein [Solirubrobacteraceae bacterium]
MTYSILGRDPETGALGVAVQSHWFSVGSVVTWGAPGVGVVATQANAEVSYGPRALELLQAGRGAQDALAELVGQDPSAASRQVAVMDGQGQAAVHTGSECMPLAGHVVGAHACCQANIMASGDVWPAMLEAFDQAAGPLPGRLLDALDAGEQAGGDLRGRQSAALLVVEAQGPPWQTAVSLRVEDDPEPLVELRRLLAVHDAYRLAGEADELVGQGRHDEAARLYRQASALDADNHELRFWAGLGAAQGGDLELAVAEIQAAIAAHPPWREFLERIPAPVAPSAPSVLARLRADPG